MVGYLPVPALAPRILPPTLLERDDLRPAALLDHLGRDRRAAHRRAAELDVVAADYQHFAELDDLAGLALDLVDLKHVVGSNPVLLAAGFDDREHRFPRVQYRPRNDRLLGSRIGFW